MKLLFDREGSPLNNGDVIKSKETGEVTLVAEHEQFLGWYLGYCENNFNGTSVVIQTGVSITKDSLVLEDFVKVTRGEANV